MKGIIIGAALLFVLIVLLVGIIGFAADTDFNRKHANKLMRLRVLSQAVAVILIILFVMLDDS